LHSPEKSSVRPEHHQNLTACRRKIAFQLHLPYGSTDPYQFYRVLNVEIEANLTQIEASYKKLSIVYHPDKHYTDNDAWTAQFQILGTIKMTLSNKGERQKYDRQSRRPNLDVERERGRAAEPPPS
jgi:hypothetical protein